MKFLQPTSLAILLLGLYCYSCSTNQQHHEMDLAEEIAYANGLDHFEDIKRLTYTFNVKRSDVTISRTWHWDRQQRLVTMMTAEDTITYHQDSVTAELKPVDHRFINDQYWLLFPYHLVWDDSLTLTDHGLVASPIKGRQLRKITVQYGQAGYTPGDAYDIYIDGEFVIREWAFRKGGQPEPSLITTWENYRDIKGVRLATMHRNKDKSFKLYFTNLILK